MCFCVRFYDSVRARVCVSVGLTLFFRVCVCVTAPVRVLFHVSEIVTRYPVRSQARVTACEFDCEFIIFELWCVYRSKWENK